MATRYYFDDDAYFSGQVLAARAVGATYSAPSYSFVGDGDTGIECTTIASDALHFVCGGSPLASIDSDTFNISVAPTLISTSLGYIDMPEQSSAPSAPPSDYGRIYCVDNGSGKTKLMVIFATGAAQQIAIEP